MEECSKVAGSQRFFGASNASWGGEVDYKDNACTKFTDPEKRCPFANIPLKRNNWSQPTGCFVYLRKDTLVAMHTYNKVLFGLGYSGQPEELQPQICVTSRHGE